MGKKIADNKCNIIALAICFFAIIAVALQYRNVAWVYDAADYWERGQMLDAGNFSLGSIDGFRGYIFPLYLGIVSRVGGKNAWYVINSLIFAILIVDVLPSISEDNSQNNKTGLIKKIVLCVLMIVLFVGLFAFPLSDLFALMCISVSVLFMKKSFKDTKYSMYYCIAMGLFAYLAYNTRTIYLFSIYLMLIIYCIFYCSGGRIRDLKKICSLGVRMALTFVGSFIAAIPQIAMNVVNLGKFKMGVPTNGLMLMQMSWGMMYQRYDTYIFSMIDENHPFPQIHFYDKSGHRLLSDAGLDNLSTWGDLIKIFISHPVDLITIYARHFVNYVFPCWPEMYVQNMHSTKWPLGLLGATVLFAAAMVLLNRCVKNGRSILYFVPLLIPAIMIIPGAVEYRFSLPLYVFAMCQLLFNTDFDKLKKLLKLEKWKFLFVYVAFVLMCFIIWSNMLASEETVMMLF